MKNRTELEKELAKLENCRFYLAMKDHWSREDFDEDDKLFREILRVKEELKKADN